MSLVLFLLLNFIALVSTPWSPVVQEPAASGEIVEIRCTKSWKRVEGKKDELLARDRDVHRKIYMGESFRCEGAGILKLNVNSVPVDLTDKQGWYPIPKTTDGDKTNTAGSSGEELVWFTGDYRLNPAESDDRTIRSFVASLSPEERARLNPTLKTQFLIVHKFALKSDQRTLRVETPYYQTFSITPDGVIRDKELPDGTDIKFMANVNQGMLFLNSSGDKFRTDIKIEPEHGGKKLVITRTIHLVGYNTPITSRAVYNRAGFGSLENRELGAASTTASSNSSALEITAELQDTINSKDLSTAIPFSLMVTAPEHLAGAIITGRIARSVDDPAKGTFFLLVEFADLRLRDGSPHRFEGAIVQIVSPTGTTMMDHVDLLGSDTLVWKRSQGMHPGTPVFSPRAYKFEHDVVLPKNTKLVVYVNWIR